MNVTAHAASRFCERCLNIVTPTKKQITNACRWLKIAFPYKTMVDGNYPLDTFEGYRAIVRSGSIITVMIKEELEDE